MKTRSGALIATVYRGNAFCPACRKKLCAYSPGAIAQGITLWCRSCKNAVLLEMPG